jgi:hypothetical protein
MNFVLGVRLVKNYFSAKTLFLLHRSYKNAKEFYIGELQKTLQKRVFFFSNTVAIVDGTAPLRSGNQMSSIVLYRHVRLRCRTRVSGTKSTHIFLMKVY